MKGAVMFEIWMKISLPGRMKGASGKKFFETINDIGLELPIHLGGAIAGGSDPGEPPELVYAESVCECSSLRNATMIRACLQMHRVSEQVDYSIRDMATMVDPVISSAVHGDDGCVDHDD